MRLYGMLFCLSSTVVSVGENPGRFMCAIEAKKTGARYLKKSTGHLLASVEDRFRFIEHYRQQFEVRIMCRVLEVSVSGFYAWKKRPMSSRGREDGVLKEQIVEIF